jgi:hypothetical protein
MGYNDLTELTLTADERLAEAVRILRILAREPEDHFPRRQQEFIEQMNDAQFVSVKQLLYLRDILSKVQ